MSTEAMPPVTQPAPGIWAALPKQTKQERCRLNLSHDAPKRTFFWVMEASGPICQDCANVRETLKVFPQSESSPSTSATCSNGKSGKKSKSTIAPIKKNAILARRANGQSKLSIAKDVSVAPATVRKVLDEADFDQQVQQGRSDCAGLLPQAIEGLKKAFAKGEGAVCCRFLEGMSVLGAEKERGPGRMYADVKLNQRITELYFGGTKPAEPAITVESRTVEPPSQ